jgi:hypothetical protein
MTPSEFGRLQQDANELKRGHADLNTRVEALKAELQANTAVTRETAEVTKDIKEVIDAARMGFKVIGGIGTIARWAGAIAFAIGTIWGLVYAAMHGGAPPK